MTREERRIVNLVNDPVCHSICGLRARSKEGRRQAHRQHLHTLAQCLKGPVYESEEPAS